MTNTSEHEIRRPLALACEEICKLKGLEYVSSILNICKLKGLELEGLELRA